MQPKINSYIGEVLPTVEEVAQVIAKRDRIRWVPSGVYALHALGLSTQIPLNLVFLTDGPARTIKVGKRTIKLKRTAPKNLMAKGKISSLGIQALREIGKDRATPAELGKILKLLKKKQRTKLRKTSNTYITEQLYREMEKRFQEKGLKADLQIEEFESSDQDPVIVLVKYPYLIESPVYVNPWVKIESRSLIEP
ncbi:DUF6088 family protein [Sunxiuqinia dokdonensis]|uniref:DUF6088 family protein n=1 Tax=Sunxiuqinia dokdonensis TaxID=1409788 RepID=UPI00069E46D6|nr:DUF6088 family protein [Sunxiuqinia dokdonensis]